MAHALSGVRVVDLTSGIAGPYLTKLLADAGADVVKVEPPEGDRLRSWSASGTAVPPGGSGRLFEFLNTSKRSVVLDVARPDDADRFRALAASAALVVEDLGPGAVEDLGLGADDLRRGNRGTSLLSISNFGRGGPWSHRVANDFTLQAQVGSTDYRGVPGEEPVCAGGFLGEYATAAYAAPAAIAALRVARRTGVGVHVDVSRYEAMLGSFQTFRFILALFDPGRDTPRAIEIPSIEPAKDGWVGYCTITGQQWLDFCSMIGAPELADDAELRHADGRMDRREEVWSKIRAFTADRTVDELVDLASAMRIPVGPIGDGRTVLANEHFGARGVYVENPAGFLQPRVPYRLGSSEPRPFAPAPRLGEHTDEVLGGRDSTEATGAAPAGATPAAAPRAAASSAPSSASSGSASSLSASSGSPTLPLAGVRVVDFTAFWAGPIATSLFGALGAEVVKVESIQRLDGMRWAGGPAGAQPLWEWSSVFHGVNPGKRDVTLDLAHPDGLALAKRLVEWGDVVVENFSPRVMEQFGLGWDDVRELNPRAVMCRMPAFGLDGPWRDRVGFAMTIEQITGLAWVTGHPSGPPLVPRGVCDPMGGMHAAFAVLLALEQREETGAGQLVEVPLVECGLNAAAEQVVEWTGNGVLLERQGNRSRWAAPQGVYESSERDRWVAVSVETDDQWRALRAVLGDPDWASTDALATHAGRLEAHDVIDEELRSWFASRPRDLAAETLVRAGVPAAPVVNGRETGWSPHHDVKPFFQWFEHPITGWTPYPSFPFTVDGEYLPYRGHTPVLGQHNDEVLREVLGLDDDTVDDLRRRKIVGERPAALG
jgi:crotonobetainyl-CoA:carnitine CoA-transferase CaiB-like acyl-CoA transferase